MYVYGILLDNSNISGNMSAIF